MPSFILVQKTKTRERDQWNKCGTEAKKRKCSSKKAVCNKCLWMAEYDDDKEVTNENRSNAHESVGNLYKNNFSVIEHMKPNWDRSVRNFTEMDWEENK